MSAPPRSTGVAPAVDADHDLACALALCALPRMGPARLLGLLGGRSPAQAWRRVLAGVEPGPPPGGGTGTGAVPCSWAVAAQRLDPAAELRRYRAAGVGAAWVGGGDYPSVLATDVEPPAVVFWQGDPAALRRPRVAIVGTRRCTRYGFDVARQLGRALADAGVAVVSGLATGIDAAAHAGALEAVGAGGAAAGPTTPGAAPVAVVGSGLDVVYPASNAELWRRVAAAGLVLSEAPLGARPERWRFPARNRVIAALADVVVVVESRPGGGAMHTVNEALRRDRPVLAVPGPVTSPASAGTNRLLADGAAPVCDVGDVLVALGLAAAGAHRQARAHREEPVTDPVEAVVLDALGAEPRSLEELAARCELSLGELALTIARLEAAGHVANRGGWFERVHQ